MQISSKLFNQQSIRNFEKLNEGIQTTQEKISTGQNILSASDDPVAAVNLSVAKEQRDLLSRFQANSESAKSRLDLADEIFDQSIVTLTTNYGAYNSSRKRNRRYNPNFARNRCLERGYD